MAQGTFVLNNQTIFDADVSPNAAIQRVKMEQRTNSRFVIPFTDLRVWDAITTLLPSAGGTDDLGLINGTWGSAPPSIQTGDVKNVGCTRRARFLMKVPNDFETNATLTIRATAGMVTTIASGGATLDVEAWRIDADGTLGAADLYPDAALSINTLAPATKDFVLDTTTITAGDLIDVRITITITDVATVTAVIGAIWLLELQADVR